MQATPTPAPAPTPAIAQVPPTPAPLGTPVPYTVVMPRSQREVNAIRQARSQMSDQLQSARSRRSELAKQYETASGTNRSGLAQQLELLDQRILQLESDIAQSGRLLTSPEVAALTASPARPFDLGPGQVTGISVVFTLFVLFPIAISIARSVWRRGSRMATPPGWTEVPHRFERLEQAVDAIAIEMERVSEGQRFMTRIMTEQQAPDAQKAAAEPPAALNGQGQQPLALGSGSTDQVFVAHSEHERIRVPRK